MSAIITLKTTLCPGGTCSFF